jgi:hypothetical protein
MFSSCCSSEQASFLAAWFLFTGFAWLMWYRQTHHPAYQHNHHTTTSAKTRDTDAIHPPAPSTRRLAGSPVRQPASPPAHQRTALPYCRYHSILKPLKIFTVFLHEFGHATAAVLSCNKVTGIEVYSSEGGKKGGFMHACVFATHLSRPCTRVLRVQKSCDCTDDLLAHCPAHFSPRPTTRRTVPLSVDEYEMRAEVRGSRRLLGFLILGLRHPYCVCMVPKGTARGRHHPSCLPCGGAGADFGRHRREEGNTSVLATNTLESTQVPLAVTKLVTISPHATPPPRRRRTS